MNRIQIYVYDQLCNMSGEDVANAFTNFYGNQLMDESFYKFLIDEGYISDELEMFEDD